MVQHIKQLTLLTRVGLPCSPHVHCDYTNVSLPSGMHAHSCPSVPMHAHPSLPAGQPPSSFPQERMRIAWREALGRGALSMQLGTLLDGLLEPLAEDRLT